MLTLPPLSLYLHFPWCIKKCPYCDFNAHTLHDPIPENLYIETLIKDLHQELSIVQNRKLVSVYFGGGTPSLLSGDAITYLLKTIDALIGINKNTEITLETNPNSVDVHRFMHYYTAGINRLSLGIQSFNTLHLKQLGRTHNSDDAHQAILTAKSAGFENFNIDLMYGLSRQVLYEGVQDLKYALQFNPPHISWYQLTLEPHTAFFHQPPSSLPSEQLIENLEQKGYEYLKKHHLNRYEISAFSLSGFECQHNCNYWQFGDYIGVGPGASSKVTDAKNNRIIRYRKLSHPKAYLTRAGYLRQDVKFLDKKTLVFDFMLNALRYYQPISEKLFENRTGLSFKTIALPLQQAVHKDLLTWDAKGIELTALGKRFYNDVVTLFLQVVK